jgi:hypothetical protein
MTRLIFIRDEFQDSGAVRYEILLQAAFHWQATDRRDMIFAFRGIADKDRPVPEPDYTVSVEDVNTDGILQAPPTLVPPNQLRLQVKAFDTVEMTCATFNSYSVTDQQTVVWEIFSLRQRLPYEVSEELWRDVVTSSLIFGLDIEDKPAGPEYREYFNEWLQ